MNKGYQYRSLLTVRVMVAISLSFVANCDSSLSILASNLDMSELSLQNNSEKNINKDFGLSYTNYKITQKQMPNSLNVV